MRTLPFGVAILPAARKASVRRTTLLLALALLVPIAACGGDDEEASTPVTDADGSETESEGSEGSESESEGSAPESESEGSGSGDDGAGAGGTASADEYADGVCRSIGGWYGEIDTASTSLVDEASTISDDPAAGKQLVLAFLDDAVGFTETLITDLEGAGVPDTESGPETADKLVSGIEDVRLLFQGARDDTEALPADDPQALGTGLQDIGSALQESATAVGANFEEVLSSVDDPELAEAFETAQSCSDLATVG